jgi:hypothetical protein
MWVIGKVNKIQRQQLENMGKRIATVSESDLSYVLEGQPVLKDNEEFVCLYMGGNLVDEVERIDKIKEASKESDRRRDLHQDRIGILEELWEVKIAQLRDEDLDIIYSYDWSCEGDTYTMSYEWCDNNDPEQTQEGYGTVEFEKDAILIKNTLWD